MRFPLWLSAWPLLSGFVAAADLILGTHAPANGDNSQQQINCIMQQTRQPYTLQVMPWRRAKQEVKMNRIDGYFTALPNEEMDEYAQLSAPLFLENWYWFWRPRHAGPDSAGHIRYGAILGSHQADWLYSHYDKPDLEVNDIAQLVQLLQIGRIDMVLADLEDFHNAARRLKMDPALFNQRFFRYIPLGVYFSRQRLAQNPGFIQHFNAATHLCASSPFALSPTEQQLILSRLFDEVRTLARNPVLLHAVTQQNRQLTDLAAILQQDNLWQQQLQAGQQAPLATAMLNSSASGVLQSWQANYPAEVTEVILMDQRGANVAISAVTTDYWQGDETPFLGIFEQATEYFIDVVEYDRSTRRFQVKLSVPLNGEHNRHIGVLSVGIDVERVLANN